MEGGTHVIHSRSRMTVDSCIPPVPGWSTVGFSPTKQTSRAPGAKRREVLGESHEGVKCILLRARTNCESDFGTLEHTFLRMDASFEFHSYVLGVGHFLGQARAAALFICKS